MARPKDRTPWFEFGTEEPFLPETRTFEEMGLSGASAWLGSICLAGIPVFTTFILTVGGDLPLAVGTAEILGYCSICAGISLMAPARWVRKQSGPNSRLYWWIGSGAVSIPLFGFFLSVAVATGYYLKWTGPLYWWGTGALSALMLAASTLWVVWLTFGPRQY